MEKIANREAPADIKNPGALRRRRRFRMVVPSFAAFNIYSGIANATTALGPVSIATVVNKMPGWDAEVIDENNMRLYGPRASCGADHAFIQNIRPADVVGLYGGLTSTVTRLYEVARFYKDQGCTVIAGGQHFATENLAEALNQGIDYIVLEEGELTIQELLNAGENKQPLVQIKGIAFKEHGQVVITQAREPIMDFDILPRPDFSLVRYAKIKLYPVGRIRGCGMDCEFCTVRGKPRSATPERLLDDISYLAETRDARHFFVVDDLFGQHRDETLRFCNMLRDYQTRTNRRLDLAVQIRLDKAGDSQLLLAMRQAGINIVAIGFESPIEEELKAMNKKVRPQDMITMARTYRKFGFLVHGMFIFGYPLQEGAVAMPMKERVKRFKRFIREARIDTVQVLLPVPLPGTELRRRLEEQHRIYPVKELGWEYYDGNFPTFEPDADMSPEELQAGIRMIMGKFYQFKYMFMVLVQIFTFPALVFFLYNIKLGWRAWYRTWRNSLVRFGGWFILRGWTSQYKTGVFSQKLSRACAALKKSAK